MGKCKNLRTVTLVTSVCCFTRHALIQEHNPLAHKALMYIQDTMDCAYFGWESMNKIMIPFVVVLICLWHTTGAMNLLVNKIKCRYHKEAMLFYILHENNLGN